MGRGARLALSRSAGPPRENATGRLLNLPSQFPQLCDDIGDCQLQSPDRLCGEYRAQDSDGRPQNASPGIRR